MTLQRVRNWMTPAPITVGSVTTLEAAYGMVHGADNNLYKL